jgi:2-oxoglutarate dehydrogenase E1 component
MTPKSLLRLPAATSSFDELHEGEFQRVLDDPVLPAGRDKVTKLVLCSGKVYYDIVGHEKRPKAEHIAVARVEMLYPFPERQLKDLMKSYPSLERVVWVQEEPRNMGPRAFMRRRMAGILPENLSYLYVGRQLRAAQSEGYTAAHRKEQARIVNVALDLEDDVLSPDRSAERPQLAPSDGS